jgi:hypothetical protein
MSAKPNYLHISAAYGAKQRLTWLRALAEKSGTTWQAARTYGFHNWAAAYADFGQGSQGTSERNRVPVWYSHTGEHFRNERFADECSEAPDYVQNSSGYFSDSFQDSTVRGIVCRLTHDRFIAGYYWSNNGERVYFGDVYTDEREAARAADSHAETYAEICREDDEKFQACVTLENDTETALQRLRECLALRNNACFAALRDEARDLLETVRKNRETLKNPEYAQYR